MHISGRVKKKMMCISCSEYLKDQYILKIGEDYWHEKCLKCSLCGGQLRDKCYEKFGSVFCANDYFRQFSKYRCFSCGMGIAPTDMVFKLRPGIICHAQCHRCSVCAVLLDPGVEIGVDEIDRRLLCPLHIDSVVVTSSGGAAGPSSLMSSTGAGTYVDMKPNMMIPYHHHSSVDSYQNSNSNAVMMNGSSGSRIKSEIQTLDRCCYDEIPEEQTIIDGNPSAKYVRRRGPRTTIRPSQLDMLNRIFGNTPKPSKHARAKLALETGLSMRVIQVWFQNRRSKERRLKHLCNRLREFEGANGKNNAAVVAGIQSQVDLVSASDCFVQLDDYGADSDDNNNNLNSNYDNFDSD